MEGVPQAIQSSDSARMRSVSPRYSPGAALWTETWRLVSQPSRSIATASRVSSVGAASMNCHLYGSSSAQKRRRGRSFNSKANLPSCAVRPLPIAFTYDSFSVHSSTNRFSRSDEDIVSSDRVSGGAKYRRAIFITSGLVLTHSTSTPSRVPRVIPQATRPFVCDRLKAIFGAPASDVARDGLPPSLVVNRHSDGGIGP